VGDHYVAWRQTHDQPALAHARSVDGPFSFCSYAWLLNPRAKSRLLHTEARFLMAQTVQQVWRGSSLNCVLTRNLLLNPRAKSAAHVAAS